MKYVHYIAGGGLGDTCRELLYNGALGVLKRWKMQHPSSHLKVLLMSHNPSSVDWFVGQNWIDDLKNLPFRLDLGWKPELVYEWYPEEFDGFTELRFTLQEKKSLYRADLQAQRLRPVPVKVISPLGMAADIELTPHERQIADHNAGRLVIHPFGGESYKWLPERVLADVVQAAGPAALVVGADYQREGHEDEVERAYQYGHKLHAFSPRVLLEIIRRARAVVGAESSVYYMAAMWGKPVAMLWPHGGTYDLVQQKKSNWDWYYGQGDSRNLFLPLPPLMTSEDRTALLDWIRTKAE